MSENGQRLPGALPMMRCMTSSLAPHHCYPALLARDARFDGQWFVAVKTTGIYCRPICRVRAPKMENCLFFSTASQAEAAQFRPCLKCRHELAPAARVWSSMDASEVLAREAARWLDECARDQASLPAHELVRVASYSIFAVAGPDGALTASWVESSTLVVK